MGGQKVEYRPQDLAQWEKDFGATRAAFRAYLRNGFYTRCSPDFYNLTGKKPTSYLDTSPRRGHMARQALKSSLPRRRTSSPRAMMPTRTSRVEAVARILEHIHCRNNDFGLILKDFSNCILALVTSVFLRKEIE